MGVVLEHGANLEEVLGSYSGERRICDDVPCSEQKQQCHCWQPLGWRTAEPSRRQLGSVQHAWLQKRRRVQRGRAVAGQDIVAGQARIKSGRARARHGPFLGWRLLTSSCQPLFYRVLEQMMVRASMDESVLGYTALGGGCLVSMAIKSPGTSTGGSCGRRRESYGAIPMAGKQPTTFLHHSKSRDLLQ